MTGTTRPLSPDSSAQASQKKARLEATGNGFASSSTLRIPPSDEVSKYHNEYRNAKPYKYAAIGGLISDELVRGSLPVTNYHSGWEGLLISSSRLSLRNLETMAFEVKRVVCRDGAGSRRRQTSTR